VDAATYVVRVWLPDRPGALGHVASRIGAVRGDVVGIEILERGGGSAIDELIVSLPDGELLDLLVAEILQVDGVAVEDVRRVAPDRLDPGTAALQLVHDVLGAASDVHLAELCSGMRDLVDGDWSAVVHVDDGAVVAAAGDVPELGWLLAFVAGSSHLGSHDDELVPGDIVWAALPRSGSALLCGRAGRVFHVRERQQVHLVVGIVDLATATDVSEVAESAGL
jgi:hypothetical protein